MAERSSTPEYLQHYRSIVDEKGPGFDATGWRNQSFQIERFRVFTEMVDFQSKVVLDAGAGQGDFASYLLENAIEYSSFHAFEAIPEMAQLIGDRSLRDVSVHTCDFAQDQSAFERVPDAQVIVFSGSLNTLTQLHAVEVLGRAWRACSEALVFNFLSDSCAPELRDTETGPANRFDTVGLVEWALQRTHLVRFRQEYLDGHDATIGMLKP
ncbi:MAG: hypothetical protein ACF8GE_08685 [Phycisphaerales bacterium JB043]